MAKRSTVVAYFVGAVVAMCAIAYAFVLIRAARTPAKSYGPAPTFMLVDQNGQAFGSAQLQGKIWVASFIYTRCKGPCPIITSQLGSLQAAAFLNPNVRFVSFTMDPENDTPAVLKKYAENSNASSKQWIFLSGPKELIRNHIMPGFSLAALDQNSDTDPVVHSTRLVLVDKKGVIRGFYNGGDTLQNAAILKALKQLEKE